MEKGKLSIVFIGAGNVATHLSVALHEAGHDIVQIYCRSEGAAKRLSEKVGAVCTTDINSLKDNADLYVISVSDSGISDVLSRYDFKGKFVIHTAGSIPIDVFNGKSDDCGVLYPLQTFSRFREIDFSNIPLCIEASNNENETFLKDLARQLSSDVRLMSSEKRKYLHLAAVFACNFTNHMYALAGEVLKGQDIDFDILKPLIQETADKVMTSSAKDAQTGPAVRNDENIIKKHLEMLAGSPNSQKIYSFVSDSIYQLHLKKDE